MSEDDRPISNLPYDESVDVSDAEDVPTALSITPRAPAQHMPISHCSDEEEEEEDEDEDDDVQTGYSAGPPPPQFHGSAGALKGKVMGGMIDEEDEESTGDEEDGEGGDGEAAAVEGGYNSADFEHLSVSSDIKELFQYIGRYTPQQVELDHKLKPFIPDFIPAVGDIDAFITIPRPDDKQDKLRLGLAFIDEPCAKQSDPTVLDLQIRAISKQTHFRAMQVSSVEDAEKNPRAIESWVNSISELHRQKPPPSVHYAKNMPDIESLMQEWPEAFENLLANINLPSAELDCDLATYCDLICSILDIPVYGNRVHSLHLLFTLYAEFKNSQHFQKITHGDYGQDGSLETQNG